MIRYRVEVCEDTESNDAYMVCVYDEKATDPGLPIADYYDITDISYPSLGDLLGEDLAEIKRGLTLADCNLVYDI